MGRGRQPIRANFFMSTGRPHHYGHCCKFKKESFQPLTLYISFHDLINMYSHRSVADNPRGQNYYVNRNFLSLRSLLQVLYMCIAPGQGLKFLCQQEHLVTLAICWQVSNKSLWSLILYNFFHDFIHVYNTGAGADSPQGTKFWCQQKCLVTSFICCKFQKKCLKSDFIQFFSWFNTFI